MYTDLNTILDDAAKNHYAVIACSPINLEIGRAIITAATEADAPIILLLGQNMMKQHAKAELIIPMVKIMAEASPVPIATCLDHGSSYERVTYAFRNGFSSIMFDGSVRPYEENVQMTTQVVQLCHTHGLGVEGELGHVGQAAQGDGRDASLYTDPKQAKDFVDRTGVDCLAIAVGTAHGEYPKGFVPHINFDRIREIKGITNGMPLALHGGSGSGDENIIKAVEAGINKVNVVTDVFNEARDYLAKTLATNPRTPYLELIMGMEQAAKHLVSHWIGLTNSAGQASHFARLNMMDKLAVMETTGKSE